MTSNEPVLQVKDLATYYYLGDKELKAVDGVSFNIHAKRTLGLAGESGCGKTTTAYSLMRILAENGKITRGSISLGGVELTELSDEQMRKIRWKKASIVFQYRSSDSRSNPRKRRLFEKRSCPDCFRSL